MKSYMEGGSKVTRGHGLLEGFLSRWRAGVADSKIPDELRKGRLLDIGCGSFPYFMTHVEFAEKHGVDQLSIQLEELVDLKGRPINFMHHDIQSGNGLPYEKEYFSAITMLAVVEHLDPASLSERIAELRGLLKPGGRLILTTPAGWTHGLLKMMSRIGLVSREEIDEHAFQYSRAQLREVMLRAGFKGDEVKLGHFEFFMNLWCVCEKQ